MLPDRSILKRQKLVENAKIKISHLNFHAKKHFLKSIFGAKNSIFDLEMNIARFARNVEKMRLFERFSNTVILRSFFTLFSQ